MPLTNEAKEKRQRRIESGEYKPSKPSFTPVSNTYKSILSKKAESPSLSTRSTRPTISRTGSGGYSSGTKYNYQSTAQNEWSAPQLAAYGRLNGDNSVFDTLSYSNNTRGTKYWSPYRGGRAVLPEDMVQFYRDRGYNGPFDQNFVNQMNALYGNDVNFTRTLAVATPTKKSTEAEWNGYYANSLADAIHDNNELDQQYAEALKQYNDFYDQYVQINGREPSLEEFTNAVDRSKFTKLKSIDDSLTYATKEQMLPNGTFYSPDIIPGLYRAKQQGKELNINTDYFEDAVQYWMNPVQQAPSVQKYDWSRDDLSNVSQEDRDKYVASLKSQGLNEEAAAYKYSWWAAQPHDDGISAEPSILDSAFGYDHNREWHDKVMAQIGDAYNARLNYDGSMDNPGKNGNYMDQACYELYQINKTYDATNEIEDEWNALVNKAIDYSSRHLQDYNADQYEDFVFNMLDELGISQSAWEEEGKNLSELSSGLNDYLKNGYDADKHCRELNISKANLNTIFKRLWDGEEVRIGVDYAADVDEDYEPHHGEDTPDELPMMYNEQQRVQANQRSADRAQAEQAIVQSTLDFADSGAQAEKDSVNVVTDTFARMADLGDAMLGVLAKVWKDTRKGAHDEKIGEEHSDTEAAAIDPVYNQLDPENVPEQVTVDDIKKLADAYVMSRAFDDDITLVHGILGYALPGIEYLHNAMMDNPDFFGDTVGNAISETFNTLTYKNVYEDRVQSGYSEEEAASTAYFAATTVDSSVNEMTQRYAGDEELENATSELINDISNEDGAKDTYTLLQAVSDDIREYQRANNGAINPDLRQFYSALLIGASARSGAGFRAETNQMLHDIIVGDVTPQDILEATGNASEEEAVDFGDFLSSLEPATETEKRLGPASNVKTITLSNGRVLTEGQYSDVINNQGKEWLKKAEGFFSSGSAYENIPEDVKGIIDYDGIMQLAKERYGEDAKYYSDFMVHDAVEALVNPDKVLHTSPLMQGRGTDMLSQISELAGSKTEEQLLANQARAKQGTLERFVKSDATGFAAALAAYSGEDQSDAAYVVDMLRTYGKFMSNDEANALWNNFSSGAIDYNDVNRLISQRITAVGGGNPQLGGRVVSAINNPGALEKSYSGIDAGLAGLQVSDTPAVNTNEIAQRLLDGESVFEISEQYPGFFDEIDTVALSDVVNMRGVLNDAEVLDRIKERLRSYDANGERQNTYTSEQADAINRFVAAYKDLGADGILLASLDNEGVKTLSGGTIDLDAAGFSSPEELLSSLNPDWATPYNMNPGINTIGAQALETVGRGMGTGFRAVLSVPGKFHEFSNRIISAALGQAYDPNQDNTYLGRVNRNFKRLEQQSRLEQQNVATQGQAFVEQGVAEVVRNALTSGIGANLGAAFAASEAANLGGVPLTMLSNVANVGDAINTTTTLINRAPFALNVFLDDFNRQMDEGNNLLKSLSMAAIHTSVELFTESPSFERWSNLRFGGFSLVEHADNAINTYGNSLVSWGMDAVKNIMSEVNEEEFSELAERVIGVVADVSEGKNVGESIQENFEGYAEAAKNTALATAFTTSIFGMADLGGMVFDVMMDSMSSGQPVDTERLLTAMEVDRYASQDESTEEAVASEQPVVEAPTEETEASTETAPAYNPATDVPFFGKKAQDAQKTLDEAVSSYTKEQTEETGKAVQDALEGVQTAMEEDRTEAVQEAAEQAAEQAAAEAEQDTEEEQKEPEQAAPELSDGAQRVQKFLEHADAAMDEAVVNKGAELQAVEAVENDPGLRSIQTSIDRLVSKSDEIAQKISGMQQTAQKITGQMEQMFRAAFDEHLDENSPQVINARNQLNQSHAAVQSDIATEQEKKDSIDREAEDAQKKMEEEQERIENEAREQAAKDYRKKIEEQKKKKAERAGEAKTPEEARELLFGKTDPKTGKTLTPQQSARLALQDMDLEDEKELNAQRAQRNGSDVHSLYTDEQYRANQKAMASEQNTRADLYADALRRGEGLFATENYVDPNNYSNAPWSTFDLTEEAKAKLKALDEEERKEREQEKAESKERQDRIDAGKGTHEDHVVSSKKSGRDFDKERAKILADSKNYTTGRGGNSQFGRRVTPLASDRRAEEWQDAAKQRQDYMTSAAGMEEEQQERLSNQFQEYIEQNAPSNYLPVSYGLYKKVMDKANAQPGTMYNDRRYGYVASEQNQAEKDNLKPAEVASGDALEERQIYTAEDIMDDRGNLTGLGAQAFLAADPSIADNPEARSVNPSNGGTDISLEYFNENDRYLIVREARSSDYYDKAPEKSDEQRRYEELTQKNHTGTTGLYRAMKRMEAVQNSLDSATSRLQNAVSAYMQAEEDFKGADEKGKKKAAIQLKNARNALKNAEDNYDVLQNSMAELQRSWNDTQTFIRNYTPVKDAGKVWAPQKYYVLDKSMLPQPKDMVELGAKVQADVSAHIEELIGKSDEELTDMVLQNALGQLGDLPEDSMELMEQMARERIKGMNRNDLIASITSNLASTYKQKRLAEMYKGAVQVFNGGEGIDKFIEEHGGTNDENVGGPGFSTFISRDHYNPGNVYLVSEEAALRFLSKEEQDKIGLNRTAAQYNAYINSTVNAFAKKNGLSDEQAAALRGAFGIGKKRGSRSLVNSTSSAIAQDDDHILAVPEKTIGVPKSNTFIREADGSYSPELAKWRLQKQLDWMVEQSNAEEAGDIDPNTSKPAVLDLDDNSIVISFVDEHGESHKARVGDYYNWYNGGSKFFPSYEWLMENADKIVCNFPCEQKLPGYNNYHTLVHFTLVPTSDVTQGHALSAELNTADYGAEQSELGHRRGHKELKQEFDKYVERFEALKGLRDDDSIKMAARRAGMNITLDLYKNELRTALANAGYATKDKVHYWQDKAIDLQLKINGLAERLITANESSGNSKVRETKEAVRKAQADLPVQRKSGEAETKNLSATERLKIAEERYEELASGEGGAMYDLPFFDVEKASLATIIPMLREQAEQEAANAPAEEQAPKQPDPMARAIAEEMVKEGPVQEEQPAISGIGLTPTGEKPKATVGTVKTVNPDDFDETYAIVRSMRRPKKGVTQVSALSPSNDLFHKYLEWKKNGEWNEQTFREKYVPQFLEEMKQPEARKALNDLYKKIKEGKNVALTCFCEDESLCHRSIIAGLLQGAGADVTTESGADYSKYYDMYKEQIGEEQKGSVDAIAKLSVLKDLSDSGADIDDIRTQETEKFHEVQMKDMSDEEKLGYAASLANQAATGASSPLIDPNTDYDAKLGEVIDQQAQKNNKRQQRRMKAISRTVYKTERGINNALAELDEFEQAGHDVAEARDALNKQLEGIRNPNQARKEAVIEAASNGDDNVKMNLGLFGQETGGETMDEVKDTMSDIVDNVHSAAASQLLEAMSTPPNNPSDGIETGFEKSIEGIQDSGRFMREIGPGNDINKLIADADAKIKNLKSDINALTKSALEYKSTAEEAGKKAKAIEDETGTAWAMEDQRSQYGKLTNRLRQILEQTQNIEGELANATLDEKQRSDKTAILEGLQTDIAEARADIEAFEGELGVSWNDTQRFGWNAQYNIEQSHNKKASSKRGQMMPLIQERDAEISKRKYMASALMSNNDRQAMIRNGVAFAPTDIAGNVETKRDTYKDGRASAVGGARKVLTELKPKMIHGFKTMFTSKNLTDTLEKTGLVDEKELDYMRSVANSTNQELKDWKQYIGLLEYGKQWLQMKKGKVSKGALASMREKMADDYTQNYRMTDYTATELRQRDADIASFKNALSDWEERLEAKILPGKNIDTVYNYLDTQLGILQSHVEQAEQLVKDYYNFSGPGEVYAALRGTRGGHMPNILHRVFGVGTILAGTDNDKTKIKKGKVKGLLNSIALELDTAPRIFERFLGDYAPLFNSVYIAPVMEANAKVNREYQDIVKRLKDCKLKGSEWTDVFHLVDQGFDSEAVIGKYGPEQGQKLIDAANTCKNILDDLEHKLNATYTRNGMETVRKRTHYMPHVKKEQSWFRRFLGQNKNLDELASNLAGRTADTAPNKKFHAAELERKNNVVTSDMDTNAFRLVCQYAEIALRNIYQTDNAVRLNDLLSALGYDERTGDIQHDYAASVLDYDENGFLTNKGKYFTLIPAIANFRNMIVGKKTGGIFGGIDRGIEEDVGRSYYSTLAALTNAQGVAKVGLNMKTAILNMWPVVVSMSTNPVATVKASYNFLTSVMERMQGNEAAKASDGSSFVASRVLDDKVPRNKYSAVTDKLFTLIQHSDKLATHMVHAINLQSIVDKMGPNPDMDFAQLNADFMDLNMMASKQTGFKSKAINSTAGNVLLQFSLEPFNNVSFNLNDLAAYEGAYNGGVKSAISGAAKALIALLAQMAVAHYAVNKLVGRNTQADAIGVVEDAKEQWDQGASASDVLNSATGSLMDQANPYDNITSGNIFDVPVITGITDITDALGQGGNTIIDAIFGKGENDNPADDWLWVKNLAKAGFNWLPGSGAVNRAVDTLEAATSGYAKSKSGKIKFGFEPTAGNITQSLLFGVNSTPEGQEYVKNGFKSVGKTDAEIASKLRKTGLSWTQSLNIARYNSEAKTANAEAKEQARWGEDNTEKLDEARSLREQAGMPSDLAEGMLDSVNEPWMQKAIEMWKESGEKTYPTDLNIYTDPERGSYIMANNKNIPVDDATAEKMRTRYYRRAKEILQDNDDPKTIAKKLSSLKTELKKTILGGEYDGEDEDSED